MTVVNGWHSLNIIINCFILASAGVDDMPLVTLGEMPSGIHNLAIIYLRVLTSFVDWYTSSEEILFSTHHVLKHLPNTAITLDFSPYVNQYPSPINKCHQFKTSETGSNKQSLSHQQG